MKFLYIKRVWSLSQIQVYTYVGPINLGNGKKEFFSLLVIRLSETRLFIENLMSKRCDVSIFKNTEESISDW